MFTFFKILISIIIFLFALLGMRCVWCFVTAESTQQQNLKEILLFRHTTEGNKEQVVSSLTSLAIETGEGVRAVLEKPQQLKLTEKAEAIGLKVSTFNKKAFDKQYSLYILNRQAVSGKLLLQAFNSENIEIGRAEKSFNLSNSTGEYLIFDMPKELRLSNISYFTLDYAP